MKQLVTASFTDGLLDEEKVLRIANALSRPNLKRYIQMLKNSIRKQLVVIEVAKAADTELLKDIEAIFSKKAVTIKENPSLLLGLRITNDDMVYDTNMKHTLDSLLTKISE